MIVLIRKEFNQVTLNGETLAFDFDLENNMPPTAEELRWRNGSGTVLRTNGDVDEITDLSEFQTLVDLYQANKNWVPFVVARKNKTGEITAGFDNELNVPFLYGGYEIDASYQNWTYLLHLIQGSELFGQSALDFWDIYGTEKSLSLVAAKALLKKLMVNYITIDKKKRLLTREIKDVIDEDYTTLNSITW